MVDPGREDERRDKEDEVRLDLKCLCKAMGIRGIS